MKHHLLITAMISLFWVTASGEDIPPPDEDAVIKESNRLMHIFKTDGFDAAVKAMTEEPYMTTLGREKDEKSVIDTFGESSKIYECYGGLSNDEPSFVGKMTSDAGYIKIVYLIPFNRGKLPVSIHWSRGTSGYYLNAIKYASLADSDLTVLLKH